MTIIIRLNNVISNVYFRIMRHAFHLKCTALITIFFECVFLSHPSFALEKRYQDYASSDIIQPSQMVNIFDNKYEILPEKLKTFSESSTFITSISNREIQLENMNFLQYQLSPKIIDSRSALTNNTKQVALAHHLLMTGSLLNNSNFTADTIFDTARSILTSAISIPMQGWLHQFGTTNLRLNLDKHFSLHDSTLDFLIPFYDSKKLMLFTQWGMRHQDNRNILNIGTGIRSYCANWMYGMNTFIDNDITRKNRRIDLGAEAWTDYFKFTVNYYFGTTLWHQERKNIDKERPASGYDIRAEGWLPAYPKLGGRIMTEKYFGNEVVLSKALSFQKNPQILTIGLNYTPIPLITLSADYHLGKGSKPQSSVGLQLTYHLGHSWQSHINPIAVAMPRTLAGNRYDLVERNNNIVMKYYTKNIITVLLPEKIFGISGRIMNLQANIDARYGLSHTTWNSPLLISAGGHLTALSPDTVAITFPDYIPETNNEYSLEAVSYDLKGNKSRVIKVVVQVNESPEKKNIVAIKNEVKVLASGLLTVIKNNAVANGLAENRVKIQVRDMNNNPIPNYSVTLTTDNNTVVDNTIIPNVVTTGVDGTVEVSLLNIRSGISHIVAHAGKTTQTVEVNFIPGPPHRSKSRVLVDSDRLPADGVSTTKITVILKDIFGNLITGQGNNLRISINPSKNFNYSPRAIGIKEIAPGSGVYTASLIAGIGSGQFKIVPKLNRIMLEARRILMTPFVKITSPNANRHIYVANGIEEAEIFVKVTDLLNRPVEKQMVKWRTNQGHSSLSETDKYGIAKYSVSTVRASENFIITATVNDQNPVESRGFCFKPDKQTARVKDFKMYRDYVKANGKESNVFFGNTVDLYGNPIQMDMHIEIMHDKNFSREIIKVIPTNIPGRIIEYLTNDSGHANTGKLRAVITSNNMCSDWIKYHFIDS